MKSVLIVEDEKMIRRGIHSMIERADIKTEEIIECRNGEEAFELLLTRPVDVMITDIRMPRMDGITLIKKVKELPQKPKIIVLSGYDDFNYAVEALKNGAKDYILKPIEREKINEIFKLLEKEIEEEHEKEVSKHRLQNQQLKYYILNNSMDEKEIRLLNKELKNSLLDHLYRICVVNPQKEVIKEAVEYIQLDNMEDQSVFILQDVDLNKLTDVVLEKKCIGVSRSYQGVENLRKAYAEARVARKYAFVCEKHVYQYDEKEENEEEIAKDFVQHFVQRFGTSNMEKGIQELKNLYFKSRMGKVDAEKLLDVTIQIWQSLYDTYRNIMDMDIASYSVYKQPLGYDNATEYLEDFSEWLEQLKHMMDTEFDDYRNKEKINQAISYVSENYSKNLNMAMVSNHVSMNYSLFSVTFKQYTGQNFVNYLKNIRLSKAKELLENTELKIIEISQMVGYDNEKHFMKLFKTTYGVSPTEYRKNIQIGKGNINSTK